VAPVPKEDVLKRAGVSLPNPQHSSDHLMLCADLQLGGTVHPHPSSNMSNAGSSSSGPLGPGSSSSNSSNSSSSGSSSHHSQQQGQSSSNQFGPFGQMGSPMGQQPGGLVMPQQQQLPLPPPPPLPAMGVSDFPSLAPLPNSAKKRDQRR